MLETKTEPHVTPDEPRLVPLTLAKEQIGWTCYHEAGHAVVRRLVGGAVAHAGIHLRVVDLAKEATGQTVGARGVRERHGNAVMGLTDVQNALICASGYAAEWRYDNRGSDDADEPWKDWSESDRAERVEALLAAQLDGQSDSDNAEVKATENERNCEDVLIVTNRLIDKLWPQIETLADVLIERTCAFADGDDSFWLDASEIDALLELSETASIREGDVPWDLAEDGQPGTVNVPFVNGIVQVRPAEPIRADAKRLVESESVVGERTVRAHASGQRGYWLSDRLSGRVNGRWLDSKRVYRLLLALALTLLCRDVG